MQTDNLKFLKALCEAPSPSGVEMPAAQVMRERLATSADSIETSVIGNVYATLKGKGDGPSVMIAGHIDQVGLMVKYITDDGYLYFDPVGGVDAAILPGQRVNVYGTARDLHQPELLRGMIGRKPIHLIEADERKTITPLDKLFIDIGMSGEEARAHVMIGDVITYGMGFEEYGQGMAASLAFDDKLGVYIASRVLEEVKAAGGAAGDLIAAGTVQEEVGLRGGETSAYAVNPDIGISAEVGHATDYPGIDKTKYGEAICGKGPLIARGSNINPTWFARMVEAAKATDTPYQIGPENRATGTDANPIQISRGGKVAGLISIPLRYMHTPTEVLALSDLEAAVKILTRFVLDLDAQVDFTPQL
ncbi:MAG: M20/M25/M40 family metallo-hydrolase [Coriobacteriales bacterium]|jgi:endoglucanase|nr:M20/M25/M40 family metallo-hydrolase [Coriobacteriales bacterium]